jgi:hypothetical protein
VFLELDIGTANQRTVERRDSTCTGLTIEWAKECGAAWNLMSCSLPSLLPSYMRVVKLAR